jgi:hypothetical protein
MKTRLFLVALAATASLTACGADDPAKPAANQEAENRKAMLAYAGCMREQGIDMPDPQFDGGRVSQAIKGGSPEKMRAADKACAKFRAKLKAPELSSEDQAEFKKAALANARCMRSKGIDFPDPEFPADGGARVKIDRSLNPESAKFKAAQKACEDTMPDGPSPAGAAGGEK